MRVQNQTNMRLDTTKLPVIIRQTRRARIFWYLLGIAILAAAYFVSGWLRTGAIALGVLVLIILEITRKVNALIIDDSKVTLSSGLLNVHTTAVYYSEITDIKISQNLWERILNYGKIYINTPGHGEYELVERNLPSPHDIRDFIEQIRHTHIRAIRKP
jgi:uncharacterized membrane protein YdbT with pleckstrin-like domain